MRCYNGMTMGRGDTQRIRTSGRDATPPKRVSDKRAIESHRQQQLANMLAFYSEPANLLAERSYFDED